MYREVNNYSTRANEDNDDVIESYSLYYMFSVFPSFVYYYTAQEPYSLIKEPAHCQEEDVLNLKGAGLKTKVMSVALRSNKPPSSVI